MARHHRPGAVRGIGPADLPSCCAGRAPRAGCFWRGAVTPSAAGPSADCYHLLKPTRDVRPRARRRARLPRPQHAPWGESRPPRAPDPVATLERAPTTSRRASRSDEVVRGYSCCGPRVDASSGNRRGGRRSIDAGRASSRTGSSVDLTAVSRPAEHLVHPPSARSARRPDPAGLPPASPLDSSLAVPITLLRKIRGGLRPNRHRPRRATFSRFRPLSPRTINVHASTPTPEW